MSAQKGNPMPQWTQESAKQDAQALTDEDVVLRLDLIASTYLQKSAFVAAATVQEAATRMRDMMLLIGSGVTFEPVGLGPDGGAA